MDEHKLEDQLRPNIDRSVDGEHSSTSLEIVVSCNTPETKIERDISNAEDLGDCQISASDNCTLPDVESCIHPLGSIKADTARSCRLNAASVSEKLTESGAGEEDRILDKDDKDLERFSINSFLNDDSVVEFSVENTINTEPEETKIFFEQKTERESHDTETDKLSRPSSSESDKISSSSSRSVHDEPQNSNYLLTEIESLLTASDGCSPDSDFEISKVDFSSAPKENLMKILSCLLDECDSLKRDKARLEGEVDRLEADHSSQVYEAQIQALEKTLAQAQADSCSWQEKLQQAEENYMKENIKIRCDLTARLEYMTKEYEAANRDKESMVIKYATSEREVIVAKKQKEAVEKKMKEMEKEREQLVSKNKMLISERARICQTLDTKVQKNNWYQREVERLKEDINSRDIKIKWAQTKLKAEMEAHQETQGKLDRALTKITKHEEELKTVKDEAESIVRTTRDSENSRANILDMQLKEEKARLIMERQANESRGSAFNRLSAELEALKLKRAALLEESTSLKKKVATYEAERSETEKLFTSLRSEVTASRQEAADLSHQLSNSTHLQQQLNREREEVATANREIDRLQANNNEIESELLACRQKEAELLAFTQKLTDKNVQIQSQFSALQSKTQLMELVQTEMKAELDELKVQKLKLKTDLAKENQTHISELEQLRRQLAGRSEEVRQLTTKVMELENEIQVLNKKHNNSLKDITREMQKLRKRLAIQENSPGGGSGAGSGVVSSGRSSQSATPHDSLSQGSRASSNTSLNTIEYQSTNGSSPHSQDSLPPLHDPIVTQQLLVDRIIKLQKSAARRSEKIEFLEEHISHLVSEVKKKSRIIHHYIMKEEAGALANSASDDSKSSIANGGRVQRKSQAELMRHGGIMASVYGSAPRDGSMTLELSLEINRKLQAVLEDTLLKNITLKENLNTLGDEIAKISRQNQELESHK
nr:coiled-coil domain-containing protein 186-like isoform X2 [Cherax quadricarinatus]